MRNLRRDTQRLREIKKKRFPFYVLESLLFENGYQAVVLYRIASWFKHRRIPLFGPLFARLSLFLTGVDIAPGAVIGPGLRISHGTGLVIGDSARLGADATLLHQVTLGAPSHRRLGDMPQVGDRVFIGAGAKLIGGITVGDDSFIGVNAVVTRNIPARSKVVTKAGIAVSEPD
ncbi:MAG: DapH/DapD/GlmU-related protein [Acidobacteriota bacterium]